MLHERLNASEHACRQLKQQTQVTHAASIRHGDQLAATEQQLQELLAAHLQQADTRDNVSLLASRQEQLQQRQKLDECQLCVVFKTTTPLPTQGPATHLQQLLSRQLQLSLTVQRVQPLGGKQHSGDSDAGSQHRHAYKVTLGSGGERTAVLRAKAQHLRGTTMSIDALLTPEQLASRQRLMPVARQAKAAGQAVRWRYGELLIAGTPYTGPGSLPSPAQQHTAAASGSTRMTAAQSRSSVDADGFQQVQSRQHQRKGPTAPNPQPRQQQKGTSAPKQQQKSSNAPKPKQKASAAPKQQQKGSTAPSKQQHSSSPASAAKRVSEGKPPQANGKVGSPALQSKPVATAHRRSPPKAKSPPMAVAGDSQPAAAAGSTAAAISDAPASSPPSPAHA